MGALESLWYIYYRFDTVQEFGVQTDGQHCRSIYRTCITSRGKKNYTLKPCYYRRGLAGPLSAAVRCAASYYFVHCTPTPASAASCLVAAKMQERKMHTGFTHVWTTGRPT